MGVNGDFAIGQILHETNFLKFKGEVKKNQNNFSVRGAMESILGKAYFNFITKGIRAHVQHMNSYASRIFTVNKYKMIINQNKTKQIIKACKTSIDISLNILKENRS